MKKPVYRKLPGPKSAEFLDLSARSEPKCAADQTPIVWDHGNGVWVWDVDGNEYIDFTSGVLVANIGHSHPKMTAALQSQMSRLQNCYSFSTPERVQAAARLLKTLPENLDRIFMLTTGAEATEAALRVVRRFTERQEVLSFHGAFHGRTYGAMGVAGSMSTRRKFGAPVPGGIQAPYGYCYRCFYDKKFPECDYYCIKALDQVVAAASTGDMAAVIVEPYQGAAGFIFPPDGWLKRLEAWVLERNLLLIVDEVQASFGRTGKMYAIDWEDIHPNLLCLGKGMGSALPASAVVGESRIFECMGAGELSSTWGGNPFSSAAVLAVLDIMEGENLPANANTMGEYLALQLLGLQKKYTCLGDVRGRGLVQGLEIVEPFDGYTPSPILTKRLIWAAAERGLLLGRVGVHGNVIRLAPPLVIIQKEIDFAVEILDEAMADCLD